jgi:hypothetical protein
MCTAQELRRIADNQRRLAALSDFPLIRDRHFAAAAQWDRLAEERSVTEAAQSG